MSTRRRDMADGYYKDDMGMKGWSNVQKRWILLKRKNRVTKIEKTNLLQ